MRHCLQRCNAIDLVLHCNVFPAVPEGGDGNRRNIWRVGVNPDCEERWRATIFLSMHVEENGRGVDKSERAPSSPDELAVAEFFELIKMLLRQVADPERRDDLDWEPDKKELASLLKVAFSTIWRWIMGESLPRRVQLGTLCRLAGRSEAEFMELAGKRDLIAPMYQKALREGVSFRLSPLLPDLCSGTEVSSGPVVAGIVSGQANCDEILAQESDATVHMGDTGQIIGLGAVQERSPDVEFSDHAADADLPLPPRRLDRGVYRTGYRPSARLERAAGVLLLKVYEQWEQEAVRRDLSVPPPIPPRWIRTDRSLVGGGDPTEGSQTRRAHAVLPGADPVIDIPARGGLEELFSLYAGQGAGRILLMGGPGSGKSATGIMLLLDELDRRGGLLDLDQASRIPIPVLLQARSWDPLRQDLAEWFAGQLETVYDILPSREYGPDPAGDLVRQGRVTLFLDEFDEMDAALCAQALSQLNSRAWPFRLVVMTRVEDFARLVEDTGLPWYDAIALELAPVAPQDAIAFLRSYQRTPAPPGDELQQLIELLEDEPNQPISQAMDTPLNLSLIYDDRKTITALLRDPELKTRGQVEDALVHRIIPRAYRPGRPGPTVQEAEKSLGFLAAQMGNDSGLDWRTMHHWAPAWERCLFNTLAGLLIMSGIGTLVYGPVGQYTVAGRTGTLFGLWYGAGMGTIFGLIAGLVSEARAPHRNKQRWPWLDRQLPTLPGGGGRLGFNSAIGLFLFLVVTMAVGNQSGNYWFGALAGVTAGGLTGSTATIPRVISGHQRWRHWSLNGWDLLAALSVGGPISWAYGTTKSVPFGISAGLITAFTFGLMASVVRPLSHSDTPPSPDAHWAHDLQRTLTLGFMTAIPIGLALGFQNGRTHGLLAGIVSTLGLGTIIALGSMAGTSDIWRVTLLFGQLRLRKRFPLSGMRFLTIARDRQVLRTAGAEYEFRHSRLRTTLATDYRRRETE